MLEGSYDPLIPYFARMQVQQLVLEYATPRAGTLEALQALPAEMQLGFGAVNPRTIALESPEASPPELPSSLSSSLPSVSTSILIVASARSRIARWEPLMWRSRSWGSYPRRQRFARLRESWISTYPPVVPRNRPPRDARWEVRRTYSWAAVAGIVALIIWSAIGTGADLRVFCIATPGSRWARS